MLHSISHLVYRLIREYGGLSRADVAKAIGRRRQVVWQWEERGRMPSREQEEILVAQAKLTPRAFVEIMCKVLSISFGEARVVIEPGTDYSPRTALARAFENYRASSSQLDPDDRAEIEEMLNQGRTLDSVVEQTTVMIEKQVGARIEAALGAKRERRNTQS